MILHVEDVMQVANIYHFNDIMLSMLIVLLTIDIHT